MRNGHRRLDGAVQEMERDQHGRGALIRKNMTVAKITKTFLMSYQVLFR